ncbi:MAG TPA: polyphosphate:AMP phosphotransferase [Thermotogota bacterium]|nr:polyphosphate:AMP phosphotransferase [Thermotogota bacterium]HRW91948.1 polyphosphate:AMP phosphotransferase [Thermotogota bacterium]
MLDSIVTRRQVSKKERKSTKELLEPLMQQLQRTIVEKQTRILLLFEGWEAAGKGKLLSRLLQPWDPRGFEVAPFPKVLPGCSYPPSFWMHWRELPPAGKIGIFDESWYHDLFSRLLAGKETTHASSLLEELYALEKMLVDDGMQLFKVFVHTGEKKQQKRLEKRWNDPDRRWQVSPTARYQNSHHKRISKTLSRLLQESSFPFAPWIVVPNDSPSLGVQLVQRELLGRLGVHWQDKALESFYHDFPGELRVSPDSSVPTKTKAWQGNPGFSLDSMDLSPSLDREQYKNQLDTQRKRMRELSFELSAQKKSLVVVFEGWDAAGKGGAIKRLTSCLDPRHVRVNPVGVPTAEEKKRHYLWRFWSHFPRAGNIAIFDRSWYGRVLVERVEGFAAGHEWKRAFSEICAMEHSLSLHGSLVVKFWLQIDKQTQLQRFEERENNPLKKWKITPDDWRNREKWDIYQPCVEEMIQRTDLPFAPWIVVEANDPYFSRVKVLSSLVRILEKNL